MTCKDSKATASDVAAPAPYRASRKCLLWARHWGRSPDECQHPRCGKGGYPLATEIPTPMTQVLTGHLHGPGTQLSWTPHYNRGFNPTHQVVVLGAGGCAPKRDTEKDNVTVSLREAPHAPHDLFGEVDIKAQPKTILSGIISIVC